MQKKKQLAVILPMAIMFLVVACEKVDSPKIEAPAATVGSETIDRRYFETEINKILSTYDLEPDSKEAQDTAWREDFLRRLIEIKRIELAARDMGVTLTEAEVNQRIQELRRDFFENDFDEMLKRQHMSYNFWLQELRRHMLIDKILAQSSQGESFKPAEEETAAYYEAHQEEFNRSKRWRVFQITAKDRDTAQAILSRLKKKEDFAALARSYSISPDAEDGGDIGYFSEGELPIEFEKVIKKLSPGELSKVVKSPFGYHIFKLADVQQEKRLSLAEAKSEIEAKLTKEKQDKWFVKWIEELRRKYPSTINKEALTGRADKGNRP